MNWQKPWSRAVADREVKNKTKQNKTKQNKTETSKLVSIQNGPLKSPST